MIEIDEESNLGSGYYWKMVKNTGLLLGKIIYVNTHSHQTHTHICAYMFNIFYIMPVL